VTFAQSAARIGRSAPSLGLLAVAALVIVELSSTINVVILPLLVVGPLIAAIGGHPRSVALVGLVATAAVASLGSSAGIAWTIRHVVAIAAVAAGTILAAVLSAVRLRHERRITEAQPIIDQAARLTRAMHAGRMGEWRWALDSGVVMWDDELHRLYGLEPDTFGGRFEDWVPLIHDEDREHVLASVDAAMASNERFRYDHRCVWPNGEVHWLEAVGEPLLDEAGQVAGAVGLAWDVDERHRQLDERARLLEVERAARVRAEFLARAHEVLTRSVDAGEIMHQVTQAAVPELGDWCAAVLALDRPTDLPLIVSAHSDPSMGDWADSMQQQFPYDPEAAFGAAKVVRSGRPEVLTDLGRLREHAPPAARALLDTADVESVVTLPVLGPLGVLGALQFVRGRARPPFSLGDLALADELAVRLGAALNTAVLFDRQTTSRAALETLQRVSGLLARAVTSRDVATAVITHGVSGLDALGAVVFTMSDGDLVAAVSEGVSDDEVEHSIRVVVDRCLSADAQIIERLPCTRPLMALVTPMRVLNHSMGALAFVFDPRRRLADDELSMVFTLGSRCAGALERAALYERDRQTSLTLQRRLLPALPPIPDWLEAGTSYRPATSERVGGDWYQVIVLADDTVIASVGDAVGHGVASAAAMGQLRASLATAVARDPDPAAAIEVVDRFAGQEADTLSASVSVAQLRFGEPLRYAAAGHPPSLLVRSDGSTEILEGGRRSLLGFGHDSARQSATASVDFRPGDTLVMYTDGLVERRRETIDVGIERLRQHVPGLRHLPVQQMCDELVNLMQADGAAFDDVAALLLRHR
jgi:GAF domain-containing protein/PAS domain-containing protein